MCYSKVANGTMMMMLNTQFSHMNLNSKHLLNHLDSLAKKKEKKPSDTQWEKLIMFGQNFLSN